MPARRGMWKAGWAPLAVLLAHWAGGGLFGHEPYVDPVMHFLGGSAAAFFFLRLALHWIGGVAPRAALDLLAFGLACGAALFWEIGEFVSDQLRNTNVQRDLENTMRDLVLGMTGAGLLLVLARWVPSMARENP